MAARFDNRHRTHCDEGLLLKGQRGDRRALSLILDYYRPLAVRIAGRYFGAGLERDDLVQEGLIGLFQAIGVFRSDRRVPFERLASVLIRRRVLSAVRAANRNRPDCQPIEDDQQLVAPLNLLGRIEASECVERTLDRLNRVLSPFERKVLGLLLADHSAQELCRQLSCSPKAVENALARIRDKARGTGAAQLLSS